MSQNKVYAALRELGGKATTTEIRHKLEEEYPDSTLYKYTTNRLRSLEEKEVVGMDESSKPFNVYIVDEDWDGIPESLAHRSFPPGSENEQ